MTMQEDLTNICCLFLGKDIFWNTWIFAEVYNNSSSCACNSNPHYQQMKFSIKDFFLEKSLMENFIFCVVPRKILDPRQNLYKHQIS